MIKSFPKGSKEQLSPHFNVSEFECPCSNCSFTFVDDGLIQGLEILREKLGAAVVIDRGGGYRCDYCQQQLKEKGYPTATGRSQHQDGKAADLRCDERSGADLEIFAAESGFKAVGVAPSWIHVDTRTDKLRRWTYTK